MDGEGAVGGEQCRFALMEARVLLQELFSCDWHRRNGGLHYRWQREGRGLTPQQAIHVPNHMTGLSCF